MAKSQTAVAAFVSPLATELDSILVVLVWPLALLVKSVVFAPSLVVWWWLSSKLGCSGFLMNWAPMRYWVMSQLRMLKRITGVQAP